MTAGEFQKLKDGSKIICTFQDSAYKAHGISIDTVVTLRKPREYIEISDCPVHKDNCSGSFGFFQNWEIFTHVKLTQKEYDRSATLDKSFDFNNLDKLF